MSWFSDALSFITGNKWDIVLVALVLAFGGGGYLGWHERVLREQALVADQTKTDADQCAKNGAVTKGTYDALIQNLRDHDAKCTASLSLRATCVPVTDANGSGSVGSAQRGSHDPHPPGLDSHWLDAYQSKCQLIQADYHACIKHDVQCVTELDAQ